jgi:predicted nucleic acid-binding protein
MGGGGGMVRQHARIHSAYGRSARVFQIARHWPTDCRPQIASPPSAVAFLLCTLNGDATHLVTYDPHLHDLRPHYPLIICEPLDFLAGLRSTQ